MTSRYMLGCVAGAVTTACLCGISVEAAAPAKPATVVSAITPAWLAGQWGQAEGKSTIISYCENDDTVTFSRSGTYEDGGSHGRYRIEGNRIIYYNRLLAGPGDDHEDRSEFNKPLVSRIERLNRKAFREGSDVYVRCKS